MDSNANANTNTSSAAIQEIVVTPELTDILHKKYLVNTMSIENMRLQQEYCKKMIKVLFRSSNACAAKILLIEKLNVILEKQAQEYTEVRQQEYIALCKDIDDIDIMKPDDVKLFKEKEELQAKMCDLLGQIGYISSTIPDTKDVIQYRAKLDYSNIVPNTQETCQAAVLGINPWNPQPPLPE